MLSLELSEFKIQLKEGSIKNVGGPTKSATVKLFDISIARARAFGDNRVKLCFADDEGNEVEVSIFPECLDSLETDIEQLRADGVVTGLE